jgi:hypothetical protein
MGIASYSGASSVIKPGVVTSSTRPSSPFVGQLIYDTTISQTLSWNGSAWIGAAGKIGQVVSVDKLDTFTTTTNGYVDVTGWAATITPTSVTSKILVIYTAVTSGDTAYWVGFQIVRGSTAIGNGTATGVATAANKVSRGSGNDGMPVTGIYLDSPATTSATTYKMQIDRNASSVLVGASYWGQNNIDNFSCQTNITLMEVLA